MVPPVADPAAHLLSPFDDSRKLLAIFNDL
jgi:hypothetical protein